MTNAGSEVPPTNGVTRLLRSLAFSGCALWLSLTGHVAGGGTAPPLGLTLALLLLTAAVGGLLAGRQRGRITVVAGMLGLQYVLHQAFAWLSPELRCALSASSRAGHPPGHTGMAMDTMAAVCDPGGTALHTGATMAGTAGTTSTMLISHVLAAVALALLLSQGERALSGLLAWCLPALPGPADVPAVPALPRPAVVRRNPIQPQPDLLSGGVGRRGPPTRLGVPA